jgi:micrococcal nuclease
MAAALGACGGGGATASPPPLTGRVVRVVDGDTIRVRLASGRVERVRYIGIDTPEAGACFDPQAHAFNARLVAGRDVRLVRDADERDRYGRLLAYVYAGDTFVNAELLGRGYAEPLVVPPNVRHAGRFAALAAAARRAGRGLWGACAVAWLHGAAQAS